MSRRIQLVQMTQAWVDSPLRCEHKTIQLRIYCPMGKATLDHDREMLLAVIACTVCRGGWPLGVRLGWELNGKDVDNDAVNIGWMLHGQHERGRSPEDSTVIGETILFDAGEEVHSGEVCWKLACGSAWNGGRKNDILTPAEMLMSAAHVLIKGILS